MATCSSARWKFSPRLSACPGFCALPVRLPIVAQAIVASKIQKPPKKVPTFCRRRKTQHALKPLLGIAVRYFIETAH